MPLLQLRSATIARTITSAGADHLVPRTDRDRVVDLVLRCCRTAQALSPLPLEGTADGLTFVRRATPLVAAHHPDRDGGRGTVMQRRRRSYAVRFTNVDLLDSVAPTVRDGAHLPASSFSSRSWWVRWGLASRPR
jgi:hypothetical protein